MIDLSRTEGLFVGQLSDDELREFDREVAAGNAYYSYEGGAAFLGLATVRLRRQFVPTRVDD